MLLLLTLSLSRVFSCPSVALASDPICDPPSSANCVQPLNKDEPAAFQGELLSIPKAIELGQKADGCDARTKLEVDRAVSTASVTGSAAIQTLRIDLHAAEVERDAYKKAADRSWFEHPLVAGFVGAAVGILVSVAAYAVAVHAIEALKP